MSFDTTKKHRRATVNEQQFKQTLVQIEELEAILAQMIGNDQDISNQQSQITLSTLIMQHKNEIL